MRRAWLLLALLAVACGGGGRAAGAGCNQDSQCESGLSCLGVAAFSADGGSCLEAAKACSKTCTSDYSCEGISDAGTFRCLKGCNAANYCASR